MKKAYRWYFLLPGDAYAMGPTPDKHYSERSARDAIRKWLKWMYGYKRIPRGTQIWKADPNEERTIWGT